MVNRIFVLRLARIATTLVIAVVAGCDSTDDLAPMGALKSSVLVTRYDDVYWGHQRTQNPQLWAEARAFCEGSDITRSPNCRPVLGWIVFDNTENRQRGTSPGIDPTWRDPIQEQQARERLRQLTATARDSQP